MEIKQLSIFRMPGSMDPQTYFNRLKDDYPSIIYYNPLNKLYKGGPDQEQYDMHPLNGLKIENFIKGTIKGGSIKGVDEPIEYSANIEIYYEKIIYIEDIYKVNKWNDVFSKEIDQNDLQIIDDKENTIQIDKTFMAFIFDKCLPAKKIWKINREIDRWQSGHYTKFKTLVYEHTGLNLDITGRAKSVNQGVSTRTPYIVFDNNNSMASELSKENKISDKLNLKNNITFAKAQYTSGDQGTYATNFKGNDVPLVPQYSLDSILEWKLSEFTTIIPTIKFQDDMRMESDDENFQNTKIPSYVLANMIITSKFGNLFSTLVINNILDRKYFNYAVASSNTLGAYNAYPQPGREIIFSLGIKF